MAAFGLVAALAWNDAVTSFIQLVFPASQNTVVAKFIYAFILTIVVVVIITNLSRVIKDSNEK